jgi:hypothetical protein
LSVFFRLIHTAKGTSTLAKGTSVQTEEAGCPICFGPWQEQADSKMMEGLLVLNECKVIFYLSVLIL